MSDVTISIRTADSDSAYTRERRYADRGAGLAIDLVIRRGVGAATRVEWNAKRGSGWWKGWGRTCRTESEAFAFADKKWPELLAWIDRQNETCGTSAAEVFSAQVAAVTR